jgi:DNA repair protein RecN (Recombination protein N)
MLEELSVRNLGILQSASFDVPGGLVVVTGETGTGKTLLMGALRLLAGENASRGAVGPGSDELTVSGRFVIDEVDVVVQRNVTTKGRSRAYLRGDISTASDLSRTIGTRVDIVAQHEGFRLATASGALTFLDGTLSAAASGTRRVYQQIYDTWRGLVDERERMGDDTRALEREREMAVFQAEEIAEAGFTVGEDADLQVRVDRLRNREEIADLLGAIDGVIQGDPGVVSLLGEAAKAVARLSRIDPSASPLVVQIEEAETLVSDFAATVTRRAIDDAEADEALSVVEARIALLGHLRRKYGDSLEDILAFGKQAAARAGEIADLISRSATLDDDIAEAFAAVEVAARDLSEARTARAEEISASATQHLSDLGFEEPVVRFAITEIPPTAMGADRVSLLFASHSSLTPAPISKIASGGELSRLVLALRLAAGIDAAEIVAFDEIDAGVGGSTAREMGARLQELASDRQVFCVTHLPQVAAFADAHIVVEREGAVATARVLSDDERVDAIAQMLSGLPESQSGHSHAAELLSSSQR